MDVCTLEDLQHQGIRQVNKKFLLYEYGCVSGDISVHIHPLSFLSPHIAPLIIFEKVKT